MKTRPLGSSGISASAVAFGAWALGGWRWGGSDDRTSIAALHAGFDAGINFIDTAPAYGFGHGEEVVGKAIRGRRDRVVVATKCGLAWNTTKGTLFFVSDEKGRNDAGQYRIHKTLDPEQVRLDLEGSLRRLGTDHVDLYLTHWQDTTIPIEDTMGLLMDLKKQGKIRAIGACNAKVPDLERYRSRGAIDADQERYSMLDRDLEMEQLPWCRRNNVAVLAYSPLHHGLLTGKISPDREFKEGDLRRGHASFTPENLKKTGALLGQIQPIAERHGLTLGQLVIAWTISQPGLTHALVGARTPQQAAENARAGSVDLSADDLAAIAAALGRA
ncbi:MAG TPA: aldo/keto reductase [Planctomycetota bacterium]|nr:aldo/keto reductase [Planctomycetota bacterium]